MNIEIKKRAEIWLGADFDEETRSRTRELFDNEKELTEAFYKHLEFGTGGLRGIMGVGTNRMNRYTVGMATQGLANYLKRQCPNRATSAAVSYDCRNNSRFFAEITAAVLSANGVKVYLFAELRPTPELSFAVRYFNCDAGVMVTASHNPKEYNGYKAYWNDGGQVTEPHDKGIIDEVAKINSINDVRFTARPELIATIDADFDRIYFDSLQSLVLSPETTAQHGDVKIVYTPIHGTGAPVVASFLRRLGFRNIIHVDEQDRVDGNFPTVVSPNPEEPEALTLALKKAETEHADLVMATDPDADRVGIAVRNGKSAMELLNGNQLASLLTYYIFQARQSKQLTVENHYTVKTIVTTRLMTKIADRFGVEIFDVLTGFKHIATVIRENEGKKKFICGGEESYGFLIGDFVRDKDAVISCGIIAEAAAWARAQGKSLYDVLMDIYCEFGVYHNRLLSVTRKGKEGLEEIVALMKGYRANPPATIAGSTIVVVNDYLNSVSTELATGKQTRLYLPVSDVLQFIADDDMTVSVRPSGTEPKIKYYFEFFAPMENRSNYQAIIDELDKKYSQAKALFTL
ncbi:MAG: phospho-sugar mutase [Prevotellaceae bacterium]|jgi:phosphoglucomutase|nr:phospho-sugar mutase [Prevotellaceae bacterium]